MTSRDQTLPPIPEKKPNILNKAVDAVKSVVSGVFSLLRGIVSTATSTVSGLVRGRTKRGEQVAAPSLSPADEREPAQPALQADPVPTVTKNPELQRLEGLPGVGQNLSITQAATR